MNILCVYKRTENLITFNSCFLYKKCNVFFWSFGKFYTEHKPKCNRKNRHFAHGNIKNMSTKDTKDTVCADLISKKLDK